jgi:hypothetical protein
MSRRVTGWIGAGLVVLFVITGLFLLIGKSETPWTPATVSYDPQCKKGCKELRSTSLTHLGNISLYVQPKVDDAIAQWGDCLDSVTQCIEDRGLTGPDIIACVEKSICPQACKVAFSAQARDAIQVNEALDAFERVFINDGGVCLPGGGNR